jgi:hypothetical protein
MFGYVREHLHIKVNHGFRRYFVAPFPFLVNSFNKIRRVNLCDIRVCLGQINGSEIKGSCLTFEDSQEADGGGAQGSRLHFAFCVECRLDPSAPPNI